MLIHAAIVTVSQFMIGCERNDTIGTAVADEHDRSSEDVVHAGDVWFAEIADQWGMTFLHESGHDGANFHIPEITGGGAAMVDINNNGLLDVYFVQSGSLHLPQAQRPGNMLYRNLGDGRFDDITESSGTGDRGYGMGVAVGDINNNGFLDLYITNLGSNVLYRNNGDETFTDISLSATVDDARYGASAAFFDMNLNGLLDLFVTNYLVWSPETEPRCRTELGRPDYCPPGAYRAPDVDVLYRNNGDETFTDISESSGVAAVPGTGLGIGCADFTGNGWIDVFVANDGMYDRLWVNQGNETFAEEGLIRGCAIDQEGIAKAGMGVAVADVNDSGWPDLIVCNLTTESDSVFRNDGGYFMDMTARSGLAAVSRAFTRFGMAWHDFDNDGWLDLYQANGRVGRESHVHSDDPYAEPNLIFRGERGPRWREVQPRGGTVEPLIATSRAAAFGDLTNNGGIDIVIVNRDGAAHVLKNVASERGNWIMFRVINEHGRDAYHATVSVQFDDRTVYRTVRSDYSYLAANDPRVHVGVGSHESVENVRVTWLDGTVEDFGAFEANTIRTLRRGEGNVAE